MAARELDRASELSHDCLPSQLRNHAAVGAGEHDRFGGKSSSMTRLPPNAFHRNGKPNGFCNDGPATPPGGEGLQQDYNKTCNAFDSASASSFASKIEARSV